MPVALVTGATGSLGRAIVLRLARDGFDIAINDLGTRTPQLQSLAKEISESNRNASIVAADVTKDNEVQQMIAQAADDLGGLDVMVANAGMTIVKPLLEMTKNESEKVMGLNFHAAFLCYKYAAKKMIGQGRGGRIIGAASSLGISGIGDQAIYSASKFAIRGLTQGAAKEWGKYGINVNTYAPGAIKTNMLTQAILNQSIDEVKDFSSLVSKFSVTGQLGEPEGIAGIVSYLAGPDGQWVTGQTMNIDAGCITT